MSGHREGSMYKELKRVTEIHRFMMGQGELLPSVEAQGAMVSVRVERAARKKGYWTGCVRCEEYHHCCMSVQRLMLSFLSKTTSSSNQANGCALLRRRPWISSRGTRRSPSLVSLTLSPLMGLFKLSKNSSMRLCSKLYSANCPDQKRSSMQVQLKKTIVVSTAYCHLHMRNACRK
jgi:hypothetical protein